MSKSLYSIILNDEVVEMVDNMARINGLSRSSMIEKILAGAVSYETPEIRANSVFKEIERLIVSGNKMRYLSQPSVYMGSIVSALSYRYNPAIKYSVELFPSSDYLGQLKVTLRTQNPLLMQAISDFYTYYSYLEKTYYNNKARCLFDGVKFTRLFNFPEVDITASRLAEIITLYVKDLDELMAIYFTNLENLDKALKMMERRFVEMKTNKIVI